jgi:hypothetical protein
MSIYDQIPFKIYWKDVRDRSIWSIHVTDQPYNASRTLKSDPWISRDFVAI